MLAHDPTCVDRSRYAEYASIASTRAATLRSAAIQVESAAGSVGRGVAAAEFSSPSAVRFHRRVDEVESGLRGTAARLTDLADALDRLSEHYQDLYLAWKAGA